MTNYDIERERAMEDKKNLQTAEFTNKYDILFRDIINLLGNMYSLNIEEYVLYPRDKKNNKAEAFVHYFFREDKIDCCIQMIRFDKDLYLNDQMNILKNTHMFFNSIGIVSDESKALASYVFYLLHEIGHIYRFRKYQKKFKKLWMLDESIYLANLLFHNITKSSKAIEQYYAELQTEANADNFALKHFYLVWKHFNLDNF